VSRLRIIVTGLAITYPLGGVFWDYVQYLLGFARLGHEVLYLEDTEQWCYDPSARTFVESGEGNASLFATWLEAIDPGLAQRWVFRDARGTLYGRSWPDVVAFCASADIFVHISFSCSLRDEYVRASRLVFIDSDPMFTQSFYPHRGAGTSDERASWHSRTLKRHHVFFTFGENVGAPECRIPLDISWIPTRQPVVLDCFAPHAIAVRARRRTLTTVTSWEKDSSGPVIGGVAYGGKKAEFERFITLPAQSRLPLEIALSGPGPIERLHAHGWNVIDAYAASRDPWTYRGYLANSLGEWSVAKNAYVAGRTGWFSCRTACYLALGVPAVVQDTGFTRHIPAGLGVLVFSSLGEAAEAIAQVAAEPERHAAAALALAREYFDARTVLTRLLDRALTSEPTVF
jgi:hypothetical protein